MNAEHILQPVAVFFLIVLAVSLRMAVLRVREFKTRRLSPQAYALRSDRVQLGTAAEATADHYSNLFEIPVVFIAACVIIHVTDRTDVAYLVMAWLWVALRAVHTVIHLTYNRVYHRFLVFVASFAVLALLVLRLAFQLLIEG